MFGIALLSTGLSVYLFVCLLLDRAERSRSFTSRTLDSIEKMDEDRRASGEKKKSLLSGLIQRLTDELSSRIILSEKQAARLRLELRQMGMGDRPEVYVARMLLSVGGGLLLGLYFRLGTTWPLLLCLLFGGYAGFTLFRFSMGRRRKDRMRRIEEQFPDMLDLLATSVTAGLGFSQAMKYVADQYKGPLSDEFRNVERSVSLGSTRRAALTEMAENCGLQEMRTFIGAVIQADELGISLANILNAQAKEIRTLNRLKKEEQAQKVSVKMLIPMVIFILPVLFIVLLAPTVASAIEAFSGGVI